MCTASYRLRPLVCILILAIGAGAAFGNELGRGEATPTALISEELGFSVAVPDPSWSWTEQPSDKGVSFVARAEGVNEALEVVVSASDLNEVGLDSVRGLRAGLRSALGDSGGRLESFDFARVRNARPKTYEIRARMRRADGQLIYLRCRMFARGHLYSLQSYSASENDSGRFMDFVESFEFLGPNSDDAASRESASSEGLSPLALASLLAAVFLGVVLMFGAIVLRQRRRQPDIGTGGERPSDGQEAPNS